jgi:hypothetical protein
MENADSNIHWAKAVYVKTGDERVITSTRFWAIPWVWGLVGSRSFIRQWRNNVEKHSHEYPENTAALRPQWKAKLSELADHSELLFTIHDTPSRTQADQAGGSVIEISVKNAGPFSVTFSDFGVSVLSPNVPERLRDRLNKELFPPLIHASESELNLPYNLGPVEPFKFWFSKREFTEVLKNNGVKGEIELSAFCGNLSKDHMVHLQPFSFNCDIETVSNND